MSYGLYANEHVRLFVKRLLFQLNLFSSWKHDRVWVLVRAESSELPNGRTQRTPDVVTTFLCPVERFCRILRLTSLLKNTLFLLFAATATVTVNIITVNAAATFNMEVPLLSLFVCIP